MRNLRIPMTFRRALGVACVLLLAATSAPLFGQEPTPQAPAPPPAQPLSPDQLDTLVAPVALYPDALLSQVLVAATYPLEVVEAAQWLQQNRNLQGSQLVDAARQQNWDPSIQALVVFPDVVSRLNSDVRWTTDLGNAFLGQQADVMNAVQRMRAEAQAAGKLNSGPQETVTTQTQGGRRVIEIAPASPEVVYVPVYDPEYIWGPPAWGYYPRLYYPTFGFGFGIGPVYIGSFFGGLGWGGWGWGPNWYAGSIFQNRPFFDRYHFGGSYYGAGFRGGLWEHNPGHRLGVPYPNRAQFTRFTGASRAGGGFSSGRFGGQGYASPRQPSLSGRNGGNFAARGNPAGRTSQSGFSPQQRGGAFRGDSQANGARSGGWQRFGAAGSAVVTGGQRSAVAAPRSNDSARNSNRSGGSWNRSGGVNSQPAYRSSPAYNGSNGNRSSGAFSGARSGGAASSYRSSPSIGGGGMSSRSAAPSGGGISSHGGGGGGSRGGGGNGGGGRHR